jgi:AAA15 family ATPase/GTPase
MENFINYIHINNFKSIQDLKLEDCRRINLFIGYPNVGKSNVLEALGLFSVPYLNEGDNINKFIRVENKNELIYKAKNDTFFVQTNLEQITVGINNYTNLAIYHNKDKKELFYHFSKELNYQEIENITPMKDGDIESNIKRYIFKTKNNWKSTGDSQLLPPFGENIIDTLSYNQNVSDVKLWIKQELKRNNLELVLDKTTNSLKVQERLNEDEVYSLPYSSLSDTLQRIIFYKTAIASNKNSVLLFEEPEAHAFPPYIQTVMQDIIDAENNQFFIVTHSPLVVNAFLEYEKLRKETSIYLFDFKDNQTTAKRLSDEEMDEVYDYGVDLFFNLESFLEDE